MPMAETAAMAAKTEAESDARPVIGIIRIIARAVIIGRGRRRSVIAPRRIGSRRRRRPIGIVVIVGAVIGGLTHAGVIGVRIVALDISRGGPGIVGAHRGSTEQACARTNGRARTGIAGGGADSRA